MYMDTRWPNDCDLFRPSTTSKDKGRKSEGAILDLVSNITVWSTIAEIVELLNKTGYQLQKEATRKHLNNLATQGLIQTRQINGIAQFRTNTGLEDMQNNDSQIIQSNVVKAREAKDEIYLERLYFEIGLVFDLIAKSKTPLGYKEIIAQASNQNVALRESRIKQIFKILQEAGLITFDIEKKYKMAKMNDLSWNYILHYKSLRNLLLLPKAQPLISQKTADHTLN